MNFTLQASKHGIRLENKNWTVEEHTHAHEMCCHHVRLALAHINWLIENDRVIKHHFKKSTKKHTKKSTKKLHK